jgi:hypothetical protein
MDRSLLLLHSLVELSPAQLCSNVSHVVNVLTTQRLLVGVDDARRREVVDRLVLRPFPILFGNLSPCLSIALDRWWKKLDSLLDSKSSASSGEMKLLVTPTKQKSLAASVSNDALRWAGVTLLGASLVEASASTIKARHVQWARALKPLLLEAVCWRLKGEKTCER